MKKSMVILLVIGMLICTGTYTYAAAPDTGSVSPLYDYIDAYSTGLEIDKSTGVATCTGTCTSLNAYTIKVDCHLQKYMGSYWVTLKTWTKSGTDYVRVQGNWAVYSGYTYRVYTTYKILNSAGTVLESTYRTQTVTYPAS